MRAAATEDDNDSPYSREDVATVGANLLETMSVKELYDFCITADFRLLVIDHATEKRQQKRESAQRKSNAERLIKNQKRRERRRRAMAMQLSVAIAGDRSFTSARQRYSLPSDVFQVIGGGDGSRRRVIDINDDQQSGSETPVSREFKKMYEIISSSASSSNSAFGDDDNDDDVPFAEVIVTASAAGFGTDAFVTD